MIEKILFRYSDVQGKDPALSDISLREIFVNTYDGRLIIKKNDGTNESIVSVGIQDLKQNIFDFDATDGQTDFTISGVYPESKLQVFTEGIKDRPGTYTVSDDGTDTTISFSQPKNANDWVEIIAFDLPY